MTLLDKVKMAMPARIIPHPSRFPMYQVNDITGNERADLDAQWVVERLEKIEEIIDESKLYQGFRCNHYTIRVGLKAQLLQALQDIFTEVKG